MKPLAALLVAFFLTSRLAQAWEAARPNEFRQLTEVNALPVALDPAFEFRKTKLLLIGDATGAKVKTKVKAAAKDPAINFETSYRLYGAVTGLDHRQRNGNYFDFFWRTKRETAVTVRLEYRQENLRSFTLAREVDYPRAKGSHKTSFAVIGDDFYNDGRVLAWRCLLIEKGRIVAENRSYLWR